MVGGLHTRLGGSIGVHPTLCHILPPPLLGGFPSFMSFASASHPPPPPPLCLATLTATSLLIYMYVHMYIKCGCAV